MLLGRLGGPALTISLLLHCDLSYVTYDATIEYSTRCGLLHRQTEWREAQPYKPGSFTSTSAPFAPTSNAPNRHPSLARLFNHPTLFHELPLPCLLPLMCSHHMVQKPIRIYTTLVIAHIETFFASVVRIIDDSPLFRMIRVL